MITGVERNFAKTVEAGHCTASVLSLTIVPDFTKCRPRSLFCLQLATTSPGIYARPAFSSGIAVDRKGASLSLSLEPPIQTPSSKLSD